MNISESETAVLLAEGSFGVTPTDAIRNCPADDYVVSTYHSTHSIILCITHSDSFNNSKLYNNTDNDNHSHNDHHHGHELLHYV